MKKDDENVSKQVFNLFKIDGKTCTAGKRYWSLALTWHKCIYVNQSFPHSEHKLCLFSQSPCHSNHQKTNSHFHSWASLISFRKGKILCLSVLLNCCISPRGHSNTGVVHMRDQRFSKHTLIRISPLQETHPKTIILHNFAHKFTPRQAFLEDMFGGVWKWPLNVLNRILKDPFSQK